MTDEFVKIFIDFLKENNCLTQYVNNVTQSRGDQIIVFKRIFEQDPKEYVTGSFLWVGTSEGPSFWCDLNQKWKSKLKRRKLWQIWHWNSINFLKKRNA